MGFLAKLFGKIDKKVNIAMCGLDNAGKTSILNFLKKGEFQECLATMGINHESIKLGKLSLSIMDLGGQEVFRYFWPSYIERADLLIFVVDSSDVNRMPIAKEIFYKAINDYCDPGIPLLFLATKQDLPNICSLAYIIHLFQLTSLYDRTIHIQRTSALNGMGIYEAFQWIYNQIVQAKTNKTPKNIPNWVTPKLS